MKRDGHEACLTKPGGVGGWAASRGGAGQSRPPLGRRCTLAVCPGEEHNPDRFSPAHRADVVRRVLAWLEEYLRPEPVPAQDPGLPPGP